MRFSPLFVLHAILLCACLANGSKGGLDDSVERLIQDEIGRKIESIKQEIKEEIERRERNRRIEVNNQKFDELQQEELLEGGSEEQEKRQQQTGVLNNGGDRDHLSGVDSDESLSKSQAEEFEVSDETLRRKRDELPDSGLTKDLESSQSGGVTAEGDTSSAQLSGGLSRGRVGSKQGNFLFRGEEARLDGSSRLSERGRDARKFKRPYRKFRGRRRRKIRVPRRRRRRKNVRPSKIDPENNLPSMYAGTFPDIVHKGNLLSRFKRV